MNKLVPFGLGAAALVAVLAIGSQFIGTPAAGGVGAGPTSEPTPTPAPTAFGGSVQYTSDGVAAITEVDAVADGTSVSGTAVSSGRGTHTVQLECAVRYGDTWALGGMIEQTTVPGERAGHWSAVIVRDGSPQRIAIWLSADVEEGSDCEAFLASHDFSTIGLEELNPVTSGELVPPPDLAP